MDLSDLDPAFAEKILLLETDAAAEGIRFVKTSGRRSFTKQAILDKAYADDPAKARLEHGVVADPAPMGLSRHHGFVDGKALAVDLGVVESNPDQRAHKQYRLGELGEKRGLYWGGRMKPKPDNVHFEQLIGGKRFDVRAEAIRLGEILDRVLGIPREG